MPQRGAAAGVALHAHRAADAGRPRRREPLPELDDPLLGQPGDRGHAVGRELEDPLAERLPADACARPGTRGPRAPMSTITPQQPERERRVGARQRRQVLVGLRSAVRVRSGSIATTCAPCLRARQDELPQVVAARQRVRAPQQDQLGLRRTSPGPCRPRCRSCSVAPDAPGDRADRHARGATRRARSTAAARRGPPAPGRSRACRCPGTARSPRRRTRRRPRAAARRSPSSASSQRDPLEAALALRARHAAAGTAAGPARACARGSR